MLMAKQSGTATAAAAAAAAAARRCGQKSRDWV